MKRVDLIKAIESFGFHLVRHRGEARRDDWNPEDEPADPDA